MVAVCQQGPLLSPPGRLRGARFPGRCQCAHWAPERTGRQASAVCRTFLSPPSDALVPVSRVISFSCFIFNRSKYWRGRGDNTGSRWP